MPDTVITLGKYSITTLLRGTDAVPPAGDFRDVSIHCRFSADAVNGGQRPHTPKPQIRVTVSSVAAPSDLVVQLTPPGGQGERLYFSRRPGPVSWARTDENEIGRVRAVSRALTRGGRTGSGWVYDNPFPETPGNPPIGPSPTPPPLGGGGGGKTYVRDLDPAVDPVGTWRVRVRNQGSSDAQCTISVEYPETIQELHETRISFQLINRAFRQAMLAIGLNFKLDSGQARITFDSDFKALTGVHDLVFNVNGALKDINLEQYNIEIGNDNGTPIITAGFDLENRGSEIGLPGPDIDVENLAVALTIVMLYGYAPGPDFFDTAMRREMGAVSHHNFQAIPFLDLHPNLALSWENYLEIILIVAATGPIGALGLAILGEQLEDYMRSAMDSAEQALSGAFGGIGAYFYDTIMHLAQRDHVMHRLESDDSALIVQHHRKPTLKDLTGGTSTDGSEGEVLEVSAGPRLGDDSSSTGGSEGEVLELSAGPRLGNDLSETDGPGGTVAGEERELLALRRLSGEVTVRGEDDVAAEGAPEINHIVFLMLENRSFDHMLGYRGLARQGVRGLSGSERNVLAPGVAPYRVFHLRQTGGIRSPEHGFGATLDQIDDGQMSGFVENYSKRPGVVDPSLVMGYYTAAELPMYEFLADNFAICDNWHSSHPGETQCNRFCAMTGETPELDNLDLSDPRIAYYDATTIFDVLTDIGIDWAYAEGNIGFLRMFDRYRLDTEHVIPFRDYFGQGIEDTFDQRVARGDLPEVTFIDPRFIDVPPQWNANDDLPPADVCQGQALVRDVYEMLSAADTWKTTLLVITYDEHGGFYDHKAPLGLQSSDDPNPVPLVHPNGATHYGVRVPAFLVTPWIDAGTVVPTAFDHTSILKTILDRFAPPDYATGQVFGPRTDNANGLLTELKRPSVRTDLPIPPVFECPTPLGNAGAAPPDNFEMSMRLLGVPAQYRGRI